jgi:hypothetical protein
MITFEVIDYHPKQKVFILKDSDGEVWWRAEEETITGPIRYFTNYPDAYKQLMKSHSLNAHSARAVLNDRAEKAIKKWEIDSQLSPDTKESFNDLLNIL